MLSRILPIALALLLPHAAPAQSIESRQLAALRSACKAELKTLKQTGAAAAVLFDAQLDALALQLSASSETDFVVGQLAVSATALMQSLNMAFAQELTSIEIDAAAALQAVGGQDDLAGSYPADLRYGSGGLLDDNRARALKAASKVRDAAVKRLAQFAKQAQLEAGLDVVALLRFPTREIATAVNQDEIRTLRQTATIDVVIAASALGLAHDGAVFVAGSTGYASDDVTVGYFRDGATTAESLVAPSISGRFSFTFTGLEEGGYAVYVMHDAGFMDSTAGISVR